MSESILVIVACGMAKIWKRNPEHGPAKAADTYTGAPFKVNSEFAKRFGDEWVILSAKYGFIPPSFVIPETYEVAFKKSATNPIDYATLAKQVRDQDLGRFERVIALGGADYRKAIQAAFEHTDAIVEFPTEGLRIGEAMKRVKQYNPHTD